MEQKTLNAPSSMRADGTSLPAHRFVPPDHSYAEPSSGHGSGIEHLLSSEHGYIVGRLENKILRLNTDGHILTVAPPRSGKGTSCIIPNLLDHPGSAFVIDIRGETLARTADARLLMGQDVVVLDPFQRTEGRWGYDCFNPLDFLEPGTPDFDAHVRRFVDAILFDEGGRSSKEPIWDNATILALSGAIFYIKTCLPKERQTLKELARMLTLVPERRAAMAEEISRTAHASHTAYMEKIDRFIEFMTYGGEKTKIPDNTVVQGMTLLDWVTDKAFDSGINSILDRSTFSFSSLQTRPTTVYLVIPEEHIKSCQVWIRLLFNTALFSLKESTAFFGRTSNMLRQSERVLFVLDEFPQFGRLQPVQDGIATVAGRGATLWLFIQNMAQLDHIYTEHAAKQIVGNSALLQAFNSNEIHELEYFSRVVGKELFDVQSVSVTMTATKGGGEGTNRTVTLGNSESITKGTSHSTTDGTSFSVAEGTSQSQTRTDTHGTSDSRTYGTTNQYSSGSSQTQSSGTSHGGGTNSSQGGGDSSNSGGGRGTSGDYTALDYLGIDLPFRNTKNDSSNWGKGTSRNWSQGMNNSWTRSRNDSSGRTTGYSHGASASRTRGTSHSVSNASTTGTSHTETQGVSHSETVGTSESESQSRSRSEAVGTSENKSWSEAQSQGYTTKAEPREIETSRSLRRSMSNGGQLLVLRGHYPFIVPRLNYYEKAALPDGQTLFRFADMALLSGSTTFQQLWSEVVASRLLLASHDRPDKLELALSPGDVIGPNMEAALSKVRNYRDAITQLRTETEALAETFTRDHARLSDFMVFINRYAPNSAWTNLQSRLVEAAFPNTRDETISELRKTLLFKDGEVEALRLAAARNALDRSDFDWLIWQYASILEAGSIAAVGQAETLTEWMSSMNTLKNEIAAFVAQTSSHYEDCLAQAARSQINRRNGQRAQNLDR